MRRLFKVFAVVLLLGAAGLHDASAGARPDDAVTLIDAEDFRRGLARWVIELEQPGRVTAADGELEVEVPAGATLWFRRRLEGPAMVEYQVMAVAADGPNDRVSDINCFWMATDPRTPDDFFARPRSGAFTDYNALRTYYVGLGGNWNATTRFRRYIGSDTERPLLPEHDLREPADLLAPNRWQTIRLVAQGGTIRYERDGRRLFDYRDARPYTSGYFGLRTTRSHLRVRRLRIYRLPAG
jgi:hypothetical protein